MSPYRAPTAFLGPAPRARWWRRALWWFHRGPRRLRLAQARREAIYGLPGEALRLAFGEHVAAGVIVLLIRDTPDPDDRQDRYRTLVCSNIRPGGREASPSP